MIFACVRLAPQRGGRHQLTPSFPRLPGIIPVVLPAGFSCRRASTVLSRNEAKLRAIRRKVTRLFLPSYSRGVRHKFAGATVNNLCAPAVPRLFTVRIPSGEGWRSSAEVRRTIIPEDAVETRRTRPFDFAQSGLSLSNGRRAQRRNPDLFAPGPFTRQVSPSGARFSLVLLRVLCALRVSTAEFRIM